MLIKKYINSGTSLVVIYGRFLLDAPKTIHTKINCLRLQSAIQTDAPNCINFTAWF